MSHRVQHRSLRRAMLWVWSVATSLRDRVTCLYVLATGERIKRLMCWQYAKTPIYNVDSPLASARLRKHRTAFSTQLPEPPKLDIGGLNPGCLCASDLYRPVIRAYPSEHCREASSTPNLDFLRFSPPVEHIDVSTTWKGLSMADAQCLFQLGRVFKESLEHLLANLCHEQDRKCKREYSMTHASGQSNSGTPTFLFQACFSRTELISTMIRLLTSSREKPVSFYVIDYHKRLLPFYLASCDYLTDIEREGFQHTAMDLYMHYGQLATQELPSTIVADTGWCPDFLTFEELTVLPREGEELRIIPLYNSHAKTRLENYQRDLRYSLESPLPWLTWHDQIKGFRGIVPMYSEIRGTEGGFGKVYPGGREGPYAVVNLLRVEIKALLTSYYQPHLRLERSVRVRLTIKVIPWYAHDSTLAPEDESIQSMKCFSTSGEPPKQSTYDDPNHYLTRRASECEIRTAGNKPGIPYPQSPPDCNLRKRRAQSSLQVNSHSKRSYQKTSVCHIEHADLPNVQNQKLDISNFPVVETPLTVATVMLSPQNEGGFMSIRESARFSPLRFHNQFSPLQGMVDCLNSSSDGSSRGQSYSSSNYGELQPSKPVMSPRRYEQCLDDEISVTGSSSTSELHTLHRHESSSDSDCSVAAHRGRAMSLDVRATSGSHWSRTARSPTDPTDTAEHNQSTTSYGSTWLQGGLASPQSLVSPRSVGPSTHRNFDNAVLNADSDTDPLIRREQAILWHLLSTQSNGPAVNEPLPTPDECKEIFEAMKKSAQEEHARGCARIGLSDVLDDVFLVDETTPGSDDDPDTVLSDQGDLASSIRTGSDLGSVDEALADSVNYGF